MRGGVQAVRRTRDPADLSASGGLTSRRWRDEKEPFLDGNRTNAWTHYFRPFMTSVDLVLSRGFHPGFLKSTSAIFKALKERMGTNSAKKQHPPLHVISKFSGKLKKAPSYRVHTDLPEDKDQDVLPFARTDEIQQEFSILC